MVNLQALDLREEFSATAASEYPGWFSLLHFLAELQKRLILCFNPVSEIKGVYRESAKSNNTGQDLGIIALINVYDI